jgi:S1-C subfamily serine protease
LAGIIQFDILYLREKMKLNKINQTLFFALTSIVLMLLFGVGFGVLELRINKRTDPSSVKEDEVPLTAETLEYSNYSEIDYGEGFTSEEKENIFIYEQRNRAVVNITTETVGYNWFLEPVPQEGSTGSGSIIDTRGYILTNHHVVENAYKVFLTLSDGTQVEGEVIGADAENDLAVVKFDSRDRTLVTIPLGDSSNLKIGQKVLAIGNPFALDRTLTTGIVSGLGRPVRTAKGLVISDMIQTDASINPGNSGGPLLNSSGEMIGINTMIFSPSGGSVGIGFAVPVDTAKRVVPDLITFGFVKRGWIDIVPVQLFPALVRYAELPVSRGILISRILTGGNAETAGLKGGKRTNAVRYGNSVIYLGGDILIQIDSSPITSLSDLYGALENTKPGDTVSATVYRGKVKKTFPIMLSERPEQFQWE